MRPDRETVVVLALLLSYWCILPVSGEVVAKSKRFYALSGGFICDQACRIRKMAGETCPGLQKSVGEIVKVFHCVPKFRLKNYEPNYLVGCVLAAKI